MLTRYWFIHCAEARQPHLQLVAAQFGQLPMQHDGQVSRSVNDLRHDT